MKFLFFTGAGISANAGISVYREEGSSRTNSDLEAKSHANRYGNHLDELWDKHWGPTIRIMAAAEPTYTHKAIAEFQKRNDAIIATQNIDLLHERAGSDNVAHLHGQMTPKCMRCKGTVVTEWTSGSPRCVNCDSVKTRPDVVLFGENLDRKLFNALESFARDEETLAVVSIGSSLNVFPATALVMDNLSKAYIINRDSTKFDKFAHSFYNEDCDVVIDDVLNQLQSLKL